MRWLKEVFLNFKRSGFMSMISIGTITITIATLGGYFIFNESIAYFETKVENKVEITAFLNEGGESLSTETLVNEIKLMPETAEVLYFSKDAAYAEFTKDEESKQVIDSLGENPLPASIVVKLKTYTQKGVEDMAKILRAKPQVEEVQYGAKEVENLINIINVIKIITFVTGLIFIIASVLVVSNVINLTVYARRQDIYIMQLVGATRSFIRMPFILEGIIHGFLGGLAGWGVVYLITNIMLTQIKKETGIDLSGFYIVGANYFVTKFLLAALGAGTALGFIGSIFSQGNPPK